MVNILQGVVQRGTAAKLRDIDFPLAGKTGTTNDSKDAWFVGFTPDLVCAVFVGFDNPVPLGSKETGASVAVPIFRSFITAAIKGKAPVPFRVPPGLRMVRVNPATEALAAPSDKNAIWESFIPGTEPQEGEHRTILDGSVTGSASMGVGAQAPATPAVPPSESGAATPTVTDEMGLVTVPAPQLPTPATTGTGGLY
jgi:penicillin-binding protein 1A